MDLFEAFDFIRRVNLLVWHLRAYCNINMTWHVHAYSTCHIWKEIPCECMKWLKLFISILIILIIHSVVVYSPQGATIKHFWACELTMTCHCSLLLIDISYPWETTTYHYVSKYLLTFDPVWEHSMSAVFPLIRAFILLDTKYYLVKVRHIWTYKDNHIEVFPPLEKFLLPSLWDVISIKCS